MTSLLTLTEDDVKDEYEYRRLVSDIILNRVGEYGCMSMDGFDKMTNMERCQKLIDHYTTEQADLASVYNIVISERSKQCLIHDKMIADYMAWSRKKLKHLKRMRGELLEEELEDLKL